MGSVQISNIGNSFAADVSSGNISVDRVDEDLQISFMKLLNQVTGSVGEDLFAGKENTDAVRNSSADVSADYSRYQYRDNTIPDRETGNVQLKQSDAVQKLDEFETEVRDVIKEELGVTDQQITDAMEVLGFTVADLMNQNRLASLVAELTGQDTGELLCDSSFMNVLQEVNRMSNELLQELGITGEQLTEIFEAMQTAEDSIPVDETAENVVADETAIQTDALADRQVETAQRMEQDTESVGTVLQADETVEPQKTVENAQTVVIRQETTEDGNLEKPVETISGRPQGAEVETETKPGSEDVDLTVVSGKTAETEEETDQTGGREETENENFSENRQGASHTYTGNVLTAPAANTNAAVPAAESTGNFSAQLDTEDIIRQIAEYSKVTVTDTQTTMEMQLNPANLGKIYLEISSKNGVVSASIMAQNAEVKAALEAQIADLKQNLNQAGVMVDAVEVTVGSHEFEHNLEDNARQEERRAEEQEKTARSTRHINLSNLDELSGLMTEEENLVAQMMAEQGNTVDFTA